MRSAKRPAIIGNGAARGRRGAAMVYVLILLLVISMIGGTLVRAAISQHRQRRRDEARAQAARLLEAGWNRAVRQLSQQPDYEGETWRLDEDILGTDRRAEIRIELRRDDHDPPRTQLQVAVEYPLGETYTNRITQTAVVANDE